MIKNLCVIAFLSFGLFGCKHRGGPGHPGDGDTTIEPYSSRIPIDTANKMIQSYLDGINYTVNTEEIRALTYNADTLRSYLKDPAIKEVKFMLAHTLEYTNSPSGHTRPDSNMHVLTMVIVGYDKDGNYVFKNNEVYENMHPCPSLCPAKGSASKNFLVH